MIFISQGGRVIYIVIVEVWWIEGEAIGRSYDTVIVK